MVQSLLQGVQGRDLHSCWLGHAAALMQGLSSKAPGETSTKACSGERCESAPFERTAVGAVCAGRATFAWQEALG